MAVRVAGTCLSRLLPGFLDGQSSLYSNTDQPPESRNTCGPVGIWCLVLESICHLLFYCRREHSAILYTGKLRPREGRYLTQSYPEICGGTRIGTSTSCDVCPPLSPWVLFTIERLLMPRPPQKSAEIFTPDRPSRAVKGRCPSRGVQCGIFSHCSLVPVSVPLARAGGALGG